MKIKLSLHLVLHKIDLHMKGGLAILDDAAKLESKITQGTLHTDLQKRAVEWCAQADALSQEVFEDSEPLFRFSSFSQANEPFDEIDPFRFLKGIGYRTRVDFRHKMKTLSEFYQYIENRSTTPLVYIPSITTLRHFDSSIKLNPDSNEHYLCKHMFQLYDFEEIVDRDLVEKMVFDDRENANGKFTKARNAANEINKRTRHSFGFPIFGLSRGSICLLNPNNRNHR